MSRSMPLATCCFRYRYNSSRFSRLTPRSEATSRPHCRCKLFTSLDTSSCRLMRLCSICSSAVPIAAILSSSAMRCSSASDNIFPATAAWSISCRVSSSCLYHSTRPSLQLKHIVEQGNSSSNAVKASWASIFMSSAQRISPSIASAGPNSARALRSKESKTDSAITNFAFNSFSSMISPSSAASLTNFNSAKASFDFVSVPPLPGLFEALSCTS
mmetsp:Transcript_62133/g.109416  ORF Transcript_62133/g.109416 Transcript_62133/m.109416 type:complete len:215 (-) Transcript_62133:626-1270(-)